MAELQSVLEARSDMQIPVIDIGPYLAGEPGALEATAKAIGAAAESLGFYFIGNHGIPQSLIDRVFGQTQNTSVYAKSTYPDASASFYIKREFAPDHPDRLAKKPWVLDNRWPKDLPGFRETCLEYYDAMSALGMKM